MCRIALMNTEGIKYVEKEVGLENFFNHLIRSQGGHGNGFTVKASNDNLVTEKGLKITAKDSADFFIKCANDNAKWFLFHTRLASIGIVKDENCHPFEHGDMVLCSNGTESWIDPIAKAMEMTDTEVLAMLCGILHVDPFKLLCGIRSVFAGFYKGEPFWINNGKTFSYHKDDNAIIFASEPFGKLRMQYASGSRMWRESNSAEELIKTNVLEEKKTTSWDQISLPGTQGQLSDEEQIAIEHRAMQHAIKNIYQVFNALYVESKVGKKGFAKEDFAYTLRKIANDLHNTSIGSILANNGYTFLPKK